ncbi:MAG: ABC transporter permease [Symploca sp. SIO1C4]|uniref:ABC transporter permease n=1 Tax=Symploca sp. SIO1C4 TaxID=2607765 RepID=A0A6B3NDM0_9CYAN|nr:ABC transporter permease [Symploca sp. SIO1C4]
MNSPKYIKIYQALPLVLFLFFWQFCVQQNQQLIFFFGSPIKIFNYLLNKTLDGSLLVDFIVTFFEASTGFILGNLLGTIIGLSLWFSNITFLIARPYIIALGSAPIFALSPLLIIWFGTGIFSKIMIATLSTVFVALFQAYTGASEVDKKYLRLLQSFGGSKMQTFRKVIAPSAIVWVVSAFRLNVGFAILGAFIGEFISSTRGLGHLILTASGLFDISLVLSGVFLLICMALLLNFLVSKSESYLKNFVVRYF